jgi:hypothetical protein
LKVGKGRAVVYAGCEVEGTGLEITPLLFWEQEGLKPFVAEKELCTLSQQSPHFADAPTSFLIEQTTINVNT